MLLLKENAKIAIVSGLILIFFISGGVQAQTNFPNGEFWSLNAGIGVSDIQVQGGSFQAIIDPKIWLSPPLMVGSKAGINYSTDNILTLEGQAYLRWNFLRLGKPNKIMNLFVQGGLGLLAAYRGDDNPFDNVTMTRGSALADAAIGVTIPITPRWHIEPLIRGGYPHIWGVSVTAGYKIPLPQKILTVTEYIEIIRQVPPTEIVKRVMISAVEFVLFGPDMDEFNVDVDRDAQALNVLVIDQTAKTLRENPNFLVRIEGHVNPLTVTHYELEELVALSAARANTVADQLRARGVREDQMVIISYGATRIVTSEFDVRNRNRRVELIIVEIDAN